MRERPITSIHQAAARTAKIAKLRNAVETGTYRVDVDALATRIVEQGVVTPGNSGDGSSS